MDTDKRRSRKWFLVLLIISLATLGTFAPPLISAWVFGEATPLVILSGTEWVSIISMIAAAYIGGNVWQKREELRAGTTINASVGASYGVNISSLSQGSGLDDEETEESTNTDKENGEA